MVCIYIHTYTRKYLDLDLINPALSEHQVHKDISGGNKKDTLGKGKKNSKKWKFFFFPNFKMKFGLAVFRFEITAFSFIDTTIKVLMKALPANQNWF